MPSNIFLRSEICLIGNRISLSQYFTLKYTSWRCPNLNAVGWVKTVIHEQILFGKWQKSLKHQFTSWCGRFIVLASQDNYGKCWRRLTLVGVRILDPLHFHLSYQLELISTSPDTHRYCDIWFLWLRHYIFPKFLQLSSWIKTE